jgi:hypothetical protein
MKVAEIGEEAMKLDEEQRIELASLILESLEGADPNDSDEDSLTEAIRRGGELRSGKVKGVPVEEFLAEFRAERAK